MRKGEYVVALTPNPGGDGYQKREKGKAYKVEEMKSCEHCGEQMINIGYVAQSNILECSCGGLMESDMLLWTSVIQFERATKENKESIINLALQIEDYETCAILREL